MATPTPTKPGVKPVPTTVKPATASSTVKPPAPASSDPTKASTAVGSASKAFAEAFKIESLEDDIEFINMLIYGKYGSGKTTLLATAADVDDMADVLLIDVESGKMSIKDNDRIERKDRIDTIRVSSFKQLAQVHKFLLAHCRYRDDPDATDKLISLEAKFRGVEPSAIKKPRRYRTCGIDSLSELDQLCLYELLGFSTDMQLDQALKDGDMETAEWAEYKKNNQMMQLIIRAYRDLPMNFLTTCHAGYTQDELKRFHYSPVMTGKLSSQVQGFVDIVGYLIVGTVPEGKTEAPRRLMVQPTGKFDAKNRKASFKEAYFEDPVMSDIWDGING